MYVRTAAFASVLVVGLGAHALIAKPATTGALNVPANRIVGLWQTQGAVGPCDTGVITVNVRNSLLFHAGGTVTENIAPTTARNMGLGTWSYDPATKLYRMRIRFDRFVNGVPSGHSTVDRELQMSADGMLISGSVKVTGYSIDGAVVTELCGEAGSERLQ
jgi:hypothetical protein